MSPDPPFDDRELTAQLIADLEKLRADVSELNQTVKDLKAKDQSRSKPESPDDAAGERKD